MICNVARRRNVNARRIPASGAHGTAGLHRYTETQISIRQRSKFVPVLFPVKPVEGFQGHGFDGIGLEATRVYANVPWMRPRNIKRFYAAMFTEIVLCNTRIEYVSQQLVFTPQQFEPGFRHDEMLIRNQAAYAAVALTQLKIRRRFNFEAHTATVTPAFVYGHQRYSRFAIISRSRLQSYCWPALRTG